MKTSTTAAIVLALATLSVGHAMAADSDAVEPVTGQKLSTFRSVPSTVGTRAQVRADAVQARDAQKKDDMVEPASGQKISSIRSVPSTVGTRAQVRADAVQARNAQNAGDVVEPATGQKLSGLFASRYTGKVAK